MILSLARQLEQPRTTSSARNGVRHAAGTVSAITPESRRSWTGARTGCRQAELLPATSRDFDPHSKHSLIPDSKSGMPRRVPFDEGVSLFRSLTVGASDAGAETQHCRLADARPRLIETGRALADAILSDTRSKAR